MDIFAGEQRFLRASIVSVVATNDYLSKAVSTTTFTTGLGCER